MKFHPRACSADFLEVLITDGDLPHTRPPEILFKSPRFLAHHALILGYKSTQNSTLGQNTLGQKWAQQSPFRLMMNSVGSRFGVVFERGHVLINTGTRHRTASAILATL